MRFQRQRLESVAKNDRSSILNSKDKSWGSVSIDNLKVSWNLGRGTQLGGGNLMNGESILLSITILNDLGIKERLDSSYKQSAVFCTVSSNSKLDLLSMELFLSVLVGCSFYFENIWKCFIVALFYNVVSMFFIWKWPINETPIWSYEGWTKVDKRSGFPNQMMVVGVLGFHLLLDVM